MLDLALRRPNGILEGAILNGIHTKRRLSLLYKTLTSGSGSQRTFKRWWLVRTTGIHYRCLHSAYMTGWYSEESGILRANCLIEMVR